MKDYNYYTVTLNNKQLNNGATGGKITYSAVMCGDCLAPLAECSHSYILRQEKRK
jgi:hypothetical protein